MDRVKKIWRQSQLALLFAAIIFVIMFIAMIIVYSGMLILNYLELYDNSEAGCFPIFVFAFISLIVGTAVALIISRLPLKPIRIVMNATDKIADGDYSVRLNLKGTEEFRNLSRKFNHMAEELGSVEMLRTDFVNDFSHEFKTPIVSIRGFAKMLKCDDLTDEERSEYLDIIVSESERLADLSTNVLNLSRIEQQTILTDKKLFNLSEQIRNCISIMDSKWNRKQINFQLYGNETYISGNEGLLKEVWLNLLDNAIKFSEDSSIVKIVIHQHLEYVNVEIFNQGKPIPEEIACHIFDKFYQGDASHATKGNGLGLTIAKKIAELHQGEITVGSKGGQWIIFDVTLPAAKVC